MASTSARNPRRSRSLDHAAGSAIASDQAEERVAREEARAKHLSPADAEAFVLASWSGRVEPFLRALADKTRLKLLGLLTARQPMTVGALAKALRVRPSTTSQHLSLLREARIIVTEKDGVKTLVRLNHDFVAWRLEQIAGRLRPAR